VDKCDIPILPTFLIGNNPGLSKPSILVGMHKIVDHSSVFWPVLVKPTFPTKNRVGSVAHLSCRPVKRVVRRWWDSPSQGPWEATFLTLMLTFLNEQPGHRCATSVTPMGPEPGQEHILHIYNINLHRKASSLVNVVHISHRPWAQGRAREAYSRDTYPGIAGRHIREVLTRV